MHRQPVLHQDSREAAASLPFPLFYCYKKLSEPMKSKSLISVLTLSALVALSGCAMEDGSRYRSDVYSANSVNRVQAVETIEIVYMAPAQVAVNVSRDRDQAKTVGMILGAIAGAAIGNHGHHSTSSRVMGGLAGGALGNLAGGAVGDSTAQEFVDGVQLTYRGKDGRLYQSAQVGNLCEYRLGSAILVAPSQGESRIQPNNPGGCGKAK